MRAKLGVAAMVLSAAVMLVGFRPVSHPSAEVRLVQAHFDSVLVELALRDVTSLSASQREARAGLTRTLLAYRDRGVFPHNYDFAAPTPYFVDRKTGTVCAVGHLLESTGRRDIVDRVAAANNNVWVAQLANDREFGAWLGQHGLTLAEAARIQMPYVIDDAPTPAVVQRNAAFSVAGSSVAGTIGFVNLWSNRDGHGRIRGLAGLASGLVSLGYGTVMFRDGSANPALAMTNVATGALSAFVAGRGMLRNRQVQSAQRDAARANVAVAPIIPSASSGGGISVAVRF